MLMKSPFPDLALSDVQRIWGEAPHSAFTDLIRFRDYFYCAFREGESHVSDDGKLRVIRSADGVHWESVIVMDWEDGDVRDAKLSISPEGTLMLNGVVRFLQLKEGNKHQSLTWLSPDGLEWSEPYADESGLGTWRWSATWNAEAAYSFGYSGKDPMGCLYRTKDGKTWEVVVDDVFPSAENPGNESAIVFTEGEKARVLLRVNTGPAQWGEADPPYTDWTWSSLDKGIGGPEMMEWEAGQFLSIVRLYHPQRTTLCWVDVEAGRLQERLTLPSGGDTSYAGVVEHEGKLWISYYSSHEEKSAIYLAVVEVL